MLHIVTSPLQGARIHLGQSRAPPVPCSQFRPQRCPGACGPQSPPHVFSPLRADRSAAPAAHSPPYCFRPRTATVRVSRSPVQVPLHPDRRLAIAVCCDGDDAPLKLRSPGRLGDQRESAVLDVHDPHVFSPGGVRRTCHHSSRQTLGGLDVGHAKLLRVPFAGRSPIDRFGIDGAIGGRSLDFDPERMSRVTLLSRFELGDEIGRYAPASISYALRETVALQPVQPAHVRRNQVRDRRGPFDRLPGSRLECALGRGGVVDAGVILGEAGDPVIARLDPLLDDAADLTISPTRILAAISERIATYRGRSAFVSTVAYMLPLSSSSRSSARTAPSIGDTGWPDCATTERPETRRQCRAKALSFSASLPIRARSPFPTPSSSRHAPASIRESTSHPSRLASRAEVFCVLDRMSLRQAFKGDLAAVVPVLCKDATRYFASRSPVDLRSIHRFGLDGSIGRWTWIRTASRRLCSRASS